MEPRHATGPAPCRPQRRPTRFEPTWLELNDILLRGEQYAAVCPPHAPPDPPLSSLRCTGASKRNEQKLKIDQSAAYGRRTHALPPPKVCEARGVISWTEMAEVELRSGRVEVPAGEQHDAVEAVVHGGGGLVDGAHDGDVGGHRQLLQKAHDAGGGGGVQPRGMGSHSFTFQLSVSAFHVTGGAFGGCLRVG